ncbi:MAG: substrate-binding domain-containing protein [Lachnospiraceae bacterium]|nr:substrate-binding domain-containing protein [Lachnospiraceae bacterium]
MKKYCFILLTICLTLLFSGCSAPSGGASESAASPISHFEPLGTVSENNKNIYVILKVMDSSYWQVIMEGCKAAGEDLSCNVYCGGTNNETDWQGQRVLIEEALAAKPDAILLSPDDSVELSSDIDRIHELGIPVALIDTAANTESFDICYMTDNLYAGQNAAKEMLGRLRDAGYSDYDDISVGIMVGTAKSQTINERLAGFYQYWSNNAPGKWSIISDIMNCNGNIDEGDALLNDFLAKHPEVVGLYATNNGPTRVLARVVKGAGRKDITVVGFDLSDEIDDLVKDPDYRASTILQRQYDMGYLAVGSVLDIMQGITPPVRFIDTGVVTVNEENMSSPEVREVIDMN